MSLCTMRSITSAIVGAVAATAILTGSLAIAAIPDSATKLITVCYTKTSGAMRLIDKATKATCNTKTEIELSWNQQGVKGDTGPQGLLGATGPAGPNGQNGFNGLNGLSGLNGVNGLNGAAGAPGAAGRDGTNGINGAPGVKGDTGLPGSNGIDGAPGPQGPAGKDGVGGAPVMYDATGAVVGTPVYPTMDTFWTGQYMVFIDPETGKLPRANVYYAASDCSSEVLSNISPRSTFGKPVVAPLLNDTNTVVVPSTSTGTTAIFWVDNVFGVTTGPGVYVLLPGGLFNLARTGDLPYQLDSSGACVAATPEAGELANGFSFVYPGVLAPAQGLHDFTGPIAPALIPMPG